MARTSRTARTRTRTRNHRGGAAPRVLPWVLMAQAVDVIRDRPYQLSVADRGRLRELISRSGGRGINLSPRERNELALIIGRADAAAARMPLPRVASRRRVAG